MMRSLLLLSVTTVAIVAMAPGAQAQYYPRGNPPPYPYDAPPPPPPPPYRYEEAPPPRYYYNERRRPIGYQCAAVAETPGGGRSIVCPLREPRPLDAGCECPPPPPPPGFSYGPPLPGRVVR